LWIRVIEVLLHAEDSFSWLVFPKLHVLELLERLLDRSRAMYTCSPRPTIVSTSMSMDLLPYARA